MEYVVIVYQVQYARPNNNTCYDITHNQRLAKHAHNHCNDRSDGKYKADLGKGSQFH